MININSNAIVDLKIEENKKNHNINLNNSSLSSKTIMI